MQYRLDFFCSTREGNWNSFEHTNPFKSSFSIHNLCMFGWIYCYLTPTKLWSYPPIPSNGGIENVNARSQTAKTTMALFGKKLVSFNHGWSFFMIMVSRMTDMTTVLNKDDIPIKGNFTLGRHSFHKNQVWKWHVYKIIELATPVDI